MYSTVILLILFKLIVIILFNYGYKVSTVLYSCDKVSQFKGALNKGCKILILSFEKLRGYTQVQVILYLF